MNLPDNEKEKAEGETAGRDGRSDGEKPPGLPNARDAAAGAAVPAESSKEKPGAVVNRPGIAVPRAAAPAPGQIYKPGRSAIYMPKLISQSGPPSAGPGFRSLAPLRPTLGGHGANGAPAAGAAASSTPSGSGQAGTSPLFGAKPFGTPRYQPTREHPANMPPPPRPWGARPATAQHPPPGPDRAKAAKTGRLEDAPPPAQEPAQEDGATGDNVLPPAPSPDEKS